MVAALVCWRPIVSAQAASPSGTAVEQRVDALLRQLTLSQKLALLGGQDDFYTHAAPEIGLPRLKMSDGPVGVRTWGPSTAYTSSLGLAATWDVELARRVGVSLGEDARARGVHFLLGPGVNTYRASVGGRNFEYFGEDPFLSAELAVPYIEGIQSQGVVATVKHFAANDQEWDRLNVSSDIDERTLHEIYLPAFEAAVKTAHVGAVMNAYSLLNGVHDTQNCPLNREILKKQWGFDGVLMSDWGSVDNGLEAARCGLDLEMPSADNMSARLLVPVVRAGQLPEPVIDDKVRRLLRVAVRFGFLDRDQTNLNIPLDNPPARAVALQEARESITLLKNKGDLLPLSPDKVHTLAVIGPEAWPAVPGGGGSSRVQPFSAESLFSALSQYCGAKVKVLYARGLPTLEELFASTSFDSPVATRENGLSEQKPVMIETFTTKDFTGKSEIRRAERIESGAQVPLRAGQKGRSIRYTVTYRPSKTGRYIVVVEGWGGDAYRLFVDNKKLLEQGSHEVQGPRSVYLDLSSGRPTIVRLDYIPGSARLQARLAIRDVDDLVSPEAKKIAAMADATILAMGFDPDTEKEGMDRTFALPWGQDELIQTVATGHRKTVVVLTGGGGVDMRGWLDNVPALLHNWYPGQAGGEAMAEILFGQGSPEGHLPATFERSFEENPVHDSYYAPATSSPGGIAHVAYKEGVFFGYRYYTTENEHPLFPFGFGLSYTQFRFDHLSIVPAEGAIPGEFQVSFDVTNVGSREGADVAQLYVGDPSAKVQRPVKELKGFAKVHLQPGESRTVTLRLDRHALAYWDSDAADWRVDPGRFQVFVGDSSEDTPLTSDFTVSN